MQWSRYLSQRRFRSGLPSLLSAPVAAVLLVAPLLSLQACGGPRAAAAPAGTASDLAKLYDGSGQEWLAGWPEPNGPFLWRVERAGAVSHIFGTVHVGVQLDELPAVVRARLDRSDSLIVEADTEDVSSPEIVRRMLLPGDQSLRAMLGEKHWKVLVKHLGEMFPAPALDRLPPWMVQTMISLEDPKSASEQSGLDGELVARARAQNKRLLYLESAEMQLDLLAELIGVKELRETLDDVAGARRALRVLLRAYRTGSLPALSGLTLNPEEMKENPEHFERLLFARNRAWMATLQREFNRGGVFVAVGAAHYVGEQGLLELLRNAGYTVTRVPALPVK